MSSKAYLNEICEFHTWVPCVICALHIREHIFTQKCLIKCYSLAAALDQKCEVNGSNLANPTEQTDPTWPGVALDSVSAVFYPYSSYFDGEQCHPPNRPSETSTARLLHSQIYCPWLPHVLSRSLSLGVQSKDHRKDRTLSTTNHDERMVQLELKMSCETE